MIIIKTIIYPRRDLDFSWNKEIGIVNSEKSGIIVKMIKTLVSFSQERDEGIVHTKQNNKLWEYTRDSLYNI